VDRTEEVRERRGEFSQDVLIMETESHSGRAMDSSVSAWSCPLASSAESVSWMLSSGVEACSVSSRGSVVAGVSFDSTIVGWVA
jgi:hypothetical protein